MRYYFTIRIVFYLGKKHMWSILVNSGYTKVSKLWRCTWRVDIQIYGNYLNTYRLNVAPHSFLKAWCSQRMSQCTVHNSGGGGDMGYGVWGMGFGVWGMGYGVQGTWSGVQGMGYGVWGTGYGVWGMGYWVWGMGYGVWGTGYGVQSIRYW